jgi:hypothetical protein
MKGAIIRTGKCGFQPGFGFAGTIIPATITATPRRIIQDVTPVLCCALDGGYGVSNGSPDILTSLFKRFEYRIAWG